MLNLLYIFVLCIAISKSILLTNDPFKCEKTYSCVDWNTVAICDASNKLVKISCGGLTPFCDNNTGTCTAYPPGWMYTQLKDRTFVCLKDGTFPDPFDCTLFHECLNGIAYTYKCASKQFFFNSLSGTCEKDIPCRSLANGCIGETGYKVTYPNDNRYFGYCNKDKPIFVDRCAADEVFDKHFQSCRPKCSKEGKICDSRNSSRFFLCTSAIDEWNGFNFKIELYDCPQGTIFNKASEDCVDTLIAMSVDPKEPSTFQPQRESTPIVQRTTERPNTILMFTKAPETNFDAPAPSNAIEGITNNLDSVKSEISAAATAQIPDSTIFGATKNKFKSILKQF